MVANEGLKTCISCGDTYENVVILTSPYCMRCCTAPWCTVCEDVLDFCEHYEREMATVVSSQTIEQEMETVMASFEMGMGQ